MGGQFVPILAGCEPSGQPHRARTPSQGAYQTGLHVLSDELVGCRAGRGAGERGGSAGLGESGGRGWGSAAVCLLRIAWACRRAGRGTGHRAGSEGLGEGSGWWWGSAAVCPLLLARAGSARRGDCLMHTHPLTSQQHRPCSDRESASCPQVPTA